MTKTWRPEGWANPYVCASQIELDTFEEGADAMLKALKEVAAIGDNKFVVAYLEQKGTLLPGLEIRGPDQKKYRAYLVLIPEDGETDLGWDDVVVRDQGIARVGFVRTLPDGRPMIMHWGFDATEYGKEKGVSYTARDLQRISEAYWTGKPLPKLEYIGGA